MEEQSGELRGMHRTSTASLHASSRHWKVTEGWKSQLKPPQIVLWIGSTRNHGLGDYTMVVFENGHMSDSMQILGLCEKCLSNPTIQPLSRNRIEHRSESASLQIIAAMVMLVDVEC